MRTFSLLKGLPVISIKNGEIIGEVNDICISANGSIEGFQVKENGLFKKPRMIEIHSVTAIGKDGLMVPNENVMKNLDSSVQYTLSHHQPLIGKSIMTVEGERLGILEDVYFMEEVGTIVGYEVTDGFFSDILEGRRVIKTAQTPAIGKDTIIINVENQ